MTWLAQVRHILAKDLVESRRMLVAYAAMVMVATASTLGPLLLGAWFMLASFGVLALGMLMVASAVYSDSPTRSDAFWATRPIRPTAMLGAKIAFALVAGLGIGLVGQFVGLRAYDIPWGSTARQLGLSVVAYGSILLFGVVLSALTRDVRSFLLALVATAVCVIVLSWIPREAWHLPRALDALLAVSAVAASVTWLARVYRRHDLQQGERLLGVGALTLTLVSWSVDAPDAPPPRAAGPGPIHVLAEYRGMNQMDRLDVGLRLPDAPVAQRLRLSDVHAVVRLLDGRVITLKGQPIPIDLRMPSVPPVPGLHWITSETRYAPEMRHGISLEPTRAQRSALAAGVAAVTVEGVLEAYDARVVDAVRPSVGARIGRAGQRARVDDWSTELGEPELRLTLTRITDPTRRDASAPGFFGYDEMRFALVNRARGEALLFDRGGLGGANGSLVLPGTQLQFGTLQLAAPFFERSKVRRDQAWFDGAELLMLEWVPRGRYAVRAEADMRPAMVRQVPAAPPR